MAWAEPSPEARIQLNWSAPPGCPAQEDVRAEVLRLLGTRAASGGAQIFVQATITQESQAYLVRLETRTAGAGGPSRLRELRGPTCKAVADAAALIMAMMIDPSAAIDSQSHQNEAPAEPPAPPAPPPTPSVQPEQRVPALSTPQENTITYTNKSVEFKQKSPIQKEVRPIHFHALGWLALDVGSAPAPAPGLGIAMGVSFGAQQVQLGLLAFPEGAYRLPSNPEVGGRVDLLAGTLDTCRAFGAWGSMRWGACGSLEIGRLHAEGFGMSRPAKADLFWLAPKGSAFVALQTMATAALIFRLEMAVPLIRARFVAERIGSLYEPSIVAGRACAGLWVPF